LVLPMTGQYSCASTAEYHHRMVCSTGACTLTDCASRSHQFGMGKHQCQHCAQAHMTYSTARALVLLLLVLCRSWQQRGQEQPHGMGQSHMAAMVVAAIGASSLGRSCATPGWRQRRSGSSRGQLGCGAVVELHVPELFASLRIAVQVQCCTAEHSRRE
jgi:hypothetical protein